MTTTNTYDVGSSSFPTPPNPLATFTHSQKETFEKFKNAVFAWDLTPKEKEHLSDLTLYRYMHGYQWRIEKACSVLKKTLEWRAKAKPENFRVSEVAEFHKLGYLYQYGYDKQGRPVLYIVLKRNKLEATEENQKLLFKHFCMIYEQCIRKMRGNVYDVTYVVDLKDCPLSVSLIKNLKSTFDELGEYYSERMSKIILVNYGWTLGILWACVKPFLEEHVVAKYKFLSASKPEEIRQHLTEYIDVNQLAPDFHGTAPFVFSLENELKREEEELKLFPA